MDTQARRPSLASVVWTREREIREIPHDVSSDPARQRLHLDHAKPCLGRAGRECPGSRRLRLEADVGDVPGRGSRHPTYPGLSRVSKLLIDRTPDVSACSRRGRSPNPRWGRRVPGRRCDRASRIPGSSRIIPAYPGLKLLIDLTVRAPGPQLSKHRTSLVMAILNRSRRTLPA